MISRQCSCHDSRNVLINTAGIDNSTLTAYQTIFSYGRPLSASSFDPRISHTRGTNLVTSEEWQHSAPKTQEVMNLVDNCYKPIVPQLCLILSFLPESEPADSIDPRSLMIPELVKHIHSFPVICYIPFNSMIQHGDPNALLLLFHFYRAVRPTSAGGLSWRLEHR